MNSSARFGLAAASFLAFPIKSDRMGIRKAPVLPDPEEIR
jgi:hypothetical protein